MSTMTESNSAGVVETLKADLSRIKAEVKNLGSDAFHLPKEALFGDVENYVRNKPLSALAIAGGVGIVIGMILRR